MAYLIIEEKVYEFFQFDGKTRNTLDLFTDLIPLKTCSLGTLIVFGNSQSATGCLNCVSLGMFVDEEAQRALARKHAAENWTCFFCYALQKIEDDACLKCGQLRSATNKSKKQEEDRKAAKKKEKEAEEEAEEEAEDAT